MEPEVEKKPEQVLQESVDLKMHQDQRKEPSQQADQATAQDQVSVTCEGVLIDENGIKNGKNVDDHESKDCQQNCKSVLIDESEIDGNNAEEMRGYQHV